MNLELRRKLDRITNTLFAGGVSYPVTYIEQISYLIFLKLLDEEENRREQRSRMGATGGGKSLYPAQSERYRWSKWRFKSGTDLHDFIRDEVFPYMASLAKDAPEVAEYFRDAKLEISDANVLKEVVDELDSVNFTELGPDVKGDIYEYLLTYLSKINAQDLGQFRTPRQIRSFMVEMIDPDAGDTIFDPACGTAGFLIDAVDYMLAKYSSAEHLSEYPIYGEDWLEKKGKALSQLKVEIPNLQTYRKGYGDKLPVEWDVLEASIFGTDVSRQMVRIAMMNLVLHGISKAKLKRANSLSDMGGLSEDDLRRKYKVILANPPFAGQLPKDSIRSDLPTNSKKSELLFLSLMMQHLAPGGRCAVVVPEGLLFGSTGAYVELRKRLVEDFDLLAVVSLPAGVFKPYAGVKTAVLVFRKPLADNAMRLGKVWFYEIRNDGFDPDKIAGGGRVETPDKNDIPDLLETWKAYKASGFVSAPGVEAGSLLEAGSEEPSSWWVTTERLAEGGYNLGAGQWKPRVAETASDEDPVELISEVLADYQKVVAGLEKLKAELAE
ncbi:N-6 DNA methylase [Pseudoxanthomonas japonensis]|uniref:type I restriction-modification system subunit M n=1 Tax=Pseudoxanthomonas japonensis TaxID=69284 RepID=UPI0037481B2C